MVNVKVVNQCYFVADLDLDGAKTYNTYVCFRFALFQILSCSHHFLTKQTKKLKITYSFLFANTYKGPGSDAELFMSETSQIDLSTADTSPLEHLYSRATPFTGHNNRSQKNVHIIFVSVTSIKRTPLFRGKGHFPGS